MKHIAFAALAASSLSLVVACSTPKSARDLAGQGALVIDQAQTEAQGFVDRATLLYRAREGVVRDLATSDINDASKVEFNEWLATQVGGSDDDQRRVDQIKRVLEKSRAVREARDSALAAKTASIKAVFGDPVALPGEKLGAAKKAFLNLAQELTAEEWLKFSRDYAKEVNDHLKASKPADAASAPASAASGA